MKKEMPVEATTAVADSFEESKRIVRHPNKDALGNYVGDDGDRLFTRDEVTTILRVRLGRQLKTILEKYGIENLEELDALVNLADKVNESIEEYRNSRAYASREQSYQDRRMAELAENLKEIGNWNYVNISKLQRFFGIGFTKARTIFNQLIELELIKKVDTAEGASYVLNKEDVASFIATFGRK